MNKFIFDVDGTLTPSRSKIDPEFKIWFTEFCVNNEVYLVTGSDYVKTQEQLGDYLLRWPVFVYNCSGSDVWAKGERMGVEETYSFISDKEEELIISKEVAERLTTLVRALTTRR